jgi:hypothetical protein
LICKLILDDFAVEEGGLMPAIAEHGLRVLKGEPIDELSLIHFFDEIGYVIDEIQMVKSFGLLLLAVGWRLVVTVNHADRVPDLWERLMMRMEVMRLREAATRGRLRQSSLGLSVLGRDIVPSGRRKGA